MFCQKKINKIINIKNILNFNIFYILHNIVSKKLLIIIKYISINFKNNIINIILKISKIEKNNFFFN